MSILSHPQHTCLCLNLIFELTESFSFSEISSWTLLALAANILRRVNANYHSHQQHFSTTLLENITPSKKDTKRRCGCLGQRQIQLTLQKISTRACETEEQIESQNDKSIHELDKQRRRLEVEKEELQVILTSDWSLNQNTDI